MIVTANPIFAVVNLPKLSVRQWFVGRRRRRATIDLIHASPHLLRDLGLGDGSTRR